jgi:phage FluMu protein Com
MIPTDCSSCGVLLLNLTFVLYMHAQGNKKKGVQQFCQYTETTQS